MTTSPLQMRADEEMRWSIAVNQVSNLLSPLVRIAEKGGIVFNGALFAAMKTLSGLLVLPSYLMIFRETLKRHEEIERLKMEESAHFYSGIEKSKGLEYSCLMETGVAVLGSVWSIAMVISALGITTISSNYMFCLSAGIFGCYAVQLLIDFSYDLKNPFFAHFSELKGLW